MTLSSALARAGRGVLAGALVLASPLAGQAPDDDYDLVLECRGALWKATFDDATAAGLDPGAAPVSFDGSGARRTRGDGVVTFRGSEEYQPSHRTRAIPVRYECVVDTATRKVLSITYEAVDASGAPIAKRPVDLVRDALLLGACRESLEDEVRDDARAGGASTDGNDLEPDPASVARTEKGKLVELTGRGRARLSKDYEWEAVTFGCRWDPRKEEVTKAWYAPVGARKLGLLTPEKREALDACRRAIRDAVWDDSAARGYRWPRDQVVVELSRRGDFAASGDRVEVKGEGWFKSDARHSQSTPIAFRCAFDANLGAVVDASFEALDASRTPTGEIASGKTGTLVCESFGKAQKVCPASIRGNVRVIRQLGSVPCKAYENWIYSLSGITVWGGCRAEFEFEGR